MENVHSASFVGSTKPQPGPPNRFSRRIR